MPNTPTAFACRYSAAIPKLLKELGCSLALSTYQAGKLILLNAIDEQRIAQLARSFKKPMGIALQGNLMAVATLNEVLVFANVPSLCKNYPASPGVYEALYLPRATYYAGAIDLHDLAWGAKGELFGINTRFSCLVQIDHTYSFRPIWQPPFISELLPEDRCHLNGLCLDPQIGLPAYATALGQGDTREQWRTNKQTGGILMDIPNNQIVLEHLPMPHSPRIYQGKLYLLLSATGQLICFDPATKQTEIVTNFGTLVRGMAIYKDYAFIGLSKIRKSSKGFADLPIANQANRAGIVAVHLPSRKIVGEIIYDSTVDEIYDVQVIEHATRVGILNPYAPDALHERALNSPNANFWQKPPLEKGEK